MPIDEINSNKDVSFFSSSQTPTPAEKAQDNTDLKVEQARAESLHTNQPSSSTPTFRASQFKSDMYSNNLLERIFLAAFLRNTAFGSESQLNQKNEETQFKDLLEPRSVLGSDLSSQKVSIALSDKQSITAYRMEKKASGS